MPPGVRVKVEVVGRDAVIKSLKAFTLEALRNVRDVVNSAAIAVQTQAKRLCPVDTGRLRSSIALRFYQGGMAAEVGTDVEYAPYIEFGTRHGQAQPFLTPAWEAVQQRFERDLKKAIEAAQ